MDAPNGYHLVMAPKKTSADPAPSKPPEKPTKALGVALTIRFDDPKLHAALLRYKIAKRQSLNSAVLTILEQALTEAKFFPITDE